MKKFESNAKRYESRIYGEGWIAAYRKLCEEQKLYARKVIDETL